MNKKKVEKIGMWLVSGFAAIASIWNTCTVRDAAKFKQPLDEHDEVSKSFVSQISSAEKRHDNTEEIRIRLLYEKYEEGWRAARKIANIIAPFENLAIYQLSSNQQSDLTKLVDITLAAPYMSFLSQKTLGAVYLALGDYGKAATQLSAVSSETKDTNALALKAAAFGGLASNADNQIEKLQYENTATQTFLLATETAKKLSGRTAELNSFAAANPGLLAILKAKNIELK